MGKYTIIHENGTTQIKKFKSDHDAVAFIDDPKNLHTYGVMDIQFKDCEGVVHTWDKTIKKWIVR